VQRVLLEMRWIGHPGRALDAHLDGEIGDEDADRVAAHLVDCRLCRQRAAVTRQIRRSLQRMIRGFGT
jgi:anti-sigma factor RsiW